MALNAFLSLKGAKQGQIKGSVTQKGREGMILVCAYHHEIVSPRDAASGMATGKRMHKPLTITKEIDKSTPLLFTALINNEMITEFVLRFWTPDAQGAGVEKQYFTIKLTNAFIVSIGEDMALNKIEPGIKLPVLEQVAFVYQNIEWTWTDGGITASDDWMAAE